MKIMIMYGNSLENVVKIDGTVDECKKVLPAIWGETPKKKNKTKKKI